jgi:hypothetical protein
MGKHRKITVCFDAHFLRSPAFLSLTGKAPQVVCIFHTKKQMGKAGRLGHQHWVILNNGEIVFPYSEASKKYGISTGQFERALSQAIERGFIDVAKPGGMRTCTKYSISERWANYGAPSFVHAHRTKDQRGYKQEAARVARAQKTL